MLEMRVFNYLRLSKDR